MIQNYVISHIRTLVPYAVGLLVSWLAIHFSIVLDPQTEALLASVSTFVLGSGFYALVRLLEAKWPSLGVLLGVPVKPRYVEPEQPLNQVKLPNPILNPAMDAHRVEEG